MTVVYIDGNSIAAMVVSKLEDALKVEAINHLELDRLVEVARRLRHPIFMDVNFCFYPEKEIIHERLQDILKAPIYQNPTVVLLTPDKVFLEEKRGKADTSAVTRRRRTLLQQQMPINPYDYPSVALFQELNTAKGDSTTRIVRIRLADLLPLSQMIRRCVGDRFIGAVPGTTAATELLDPLRQEAGESGITVCEVGKLRTVYTTVFGDDPPTVRTIPVGLARDDMHYFASISPDTSKLAYLQSTIGSLLFPPEASPSPLFSDQLVSPQADCTRMAVQISRYAMRALETTRRRKGDPPLEPIHYLAGRGSRVPGIRDFIESKLHDTIRRIDRRPLPGVILSEKYNWGEVADNLLALGAAKAVLQPTSNGVGLITENWLYPPMKHGRCTVESLELGMMYVFEHKPEDYTPSLL